MRDYIDDILSAGDILTEDIQLRKETMRNAAESKSAAYHATNPDLSVHPMYTNDVHADDSLRIVLTRMRVSSHRLKIETGRWARIDREDRLCQCGQAVQDEKHVIVDCPLVQDIRERYDRRAIDFVTFMNSQPTKIDLCMLSDIVQFYEE